MNPLSTLLLALGMSADAFAAAAAKGAVLARPRLREALRVGLIFGGTEALTPLIGWALGRAASGHIAAVDHWLAFALLLAIGIKMIHDGLGRDADADADAARPPRHGFAVLALTALGTSMDALAVGVTLALIGANIWISALAIGTASFTMATIGVLAGHRLGTRLGRHAEVVGGVVLILVGTAILFEHLTA